MSFLTRHIRDTMAPQTYFTHGWFAFSTSCALIGAGVIGIIHAIFPWWFRFYTAEQIIRFYSKVNKSGRHDDLIAKIVPSVPSEPTQEMLLAGARSIGSTMRYINHTERAHDCYDAMLYVWDEKIGEYE